MPSTDFLVQNLVHVAAIFTLVCFMFRDQIKLRLFAALGDALLSAYYYLAFAEPLWNPMYWSIANVVINIGMIVILLREHRMSLLSDNEMTLFRCLETLTPGQFRKLLKLATWHEVEEPVQLTTEGEPPDKIFYVLDGKVNIGSRGGCWSGSRSCSSAKSHFCATRLRPRRSPPQPRRFMSPGSKASCGRC